MDPIETVKALTGTTLDDDTIYTILVLHDATGEPPEWVVYRAAADVADREAARLTATAGVTAVEDITIDRGKARDGWWALAARLRARADELEHADDGMTAVEFHPAGWGRPEATEWA